MSPFFTTLVMIEFLLATAIFAYAYPRRKLFWVRLLISLAITITAAYFLGKYLPNKKIYHFLNFFLQYIFCAASVFACFKVSIFQAMTAGAAGFATQHFSYNLITLISIWFRVSSLFGKEVHYIVTSLVEGAMFKLPIYTLTFFTFGRQLKGMEINGKGKISAAVVSIAIVLVCVGITRFARDSWRNQNAIIAESLYAMVCCVSALVILLAINANFRLRRSEAMLRALLREEKRQYEAKKENSAQLKIRMHDLQHRLDHLESMLPSSEYESLKEAIQAYDSPFKTGNSALDIILTNINMTCQSKKISLTFIGDGCVLNFLKEEEIYSLVENAVDNAIDAVSQLDEDSRHISMSIETAGDLIILNMLNFYKGDLSFDKGLPQTTKKEDAGFHGYGMISIQRIAEKYQGGVTVRAENGMFSLTVFLEKPE